jgi:serine/threonine protein kinase
MTPEVVTLWYRAPELLYGQKKYDIKIDMWSVGCIFAELLLHKPLMQGKNEQDQRDKILELLGTPDEDNWPDFNLLPGAKHVRYKKRQSVLREKIPLYSYTGDATLSDRGYDLLKRLLSYSPAMRISAHEALRDEMGYFDEAPKECKPEHMPTYPSTHEAPKGQKKRARSPVDQGSLSPPAGPTTHCLFSTGHPQRLQAVSGTQMFVLEH